MPTYLLGAWGGSSFEHVVREEPFAEVTCHLKGGKGSSYGKRADQMPDKESAVASGR